jgi:hypothetical protein
MITITPTGYKHDTEVLENEIVMSSRGNIQQTGTQRQQVCIYGV